jgi:putative transposase
VYRTFRYELHPTSEQAEALRQQIGTTRFVYNLALEQRRDWWRQFRRNRGQPITLASQSKELTQLRAEVDWIAAGVRASQEYALRDLDEAFAKWRAGKCSYPTMRRRSDGAGVRFHGKDCWVRRLNAKWATVLLHKVGVVKFRSTRPLMGKVSNAAVCEAAGRWFVSFRCSITHSTAPGEFESVGVDRGVATTLALSTGETFTLAPVTRPQAQRLVRAQQTLSRRKRGSKRYERQRGRLAGLYAQMARVRADFLHKASLTIAERFSVVALEDLKVRDMTASARGTIAVPGRNVRQRAGLNRAIRHQSWGAFERFLAYKLEERGGTLIKVPPAYTSQTCAECGVVDARSRKSQAIFECVACGHTDNADVNAAREILRRSTALMGVEGVHFAPAEALTAEPLAA